MSKITSVLKTLKNNWKKSAFAVGAISYGIGYGHERYEIHQLMRKYCTEAIAYGDVTEPNHAKLRKVLVILNPVANKRSASETYENYCAPLLHLAGFAVEVVKTDSEGHARRLIEELEKLPDSILIAGGDGTLSETITGLMRRPQHEPCPIGILPVGRTNSIASKLFNFDKSSDLKEIEGIANATISVVRGKTEPKDIMKIEIIEEEQNGSKEDPQIPATPPPKPVYAFNAIEWGAYRDVYSLKDQYWYFGPLREYSAFLFNSFSSKITWNCPAKLLYSQPCVGCSHCWQKPYEKPTQNRWWSWFVPKLNRAPAGPDYSKVTNESCATKLELTVDPSDFLLSTNVRRQPNEIPQLEIKLTQKEYSTIDFWQHSYERLQHEKYAIKDVLNVRTVEIYPENVSTDDKELFYSIDNDAYEVKPIRVSIVPRAIQVYTL